MRGVMLLWVLGAAGCSPAPAPGRIPRAAAEVDAAVVQLSSECTGTLVGPRAVLTAAHCVEEPGPWHVRVDAPTERASIAVIDCAVHPRAYATPRGCGAGAGRTAPDHDLALLTLARSPRGVRPVEVVLTAPHPRPRWWRDRRVRLIGWHRRPRLVGPLSRDGGPNRIVALDPGAFRTAPLGGRGFATRVGDSGAPALLWQPGGERVLGVLYGGPAPGARSSIFAATYAPANARWLLERAGSEFARDLAHLDPDDPWDQADWSDLAVRLRAAAGVTGPPNPR